MLHQKNIYKAKSDTMEKIDELDKRILEIISQNARTPFKDVAVECGVSRAAIHQRVQRLMDIGAIIGSGYHVNPKMLGFRTCTYVGLSLAKGSMYKEAIAELKKIPEIVEAHFTTGPYSIIVKLYARDNEHLMNLRENTGCESRRFSIKKQAVRSSARTACENHLCFRAMPFSTGERGL